MGVSVQVHSTQSVCRGVCMCVCVFVAVLNTDISLGSPSAGLWDGHAASVQLSNHVVQWDCCSSLQWT